MSYSLNLFGKELADLVYADIQSFFKERRDETETLEFKSYNDKTSEKDRYTKILETICAFLNSSGGIIIYGAPAPTPEIVDGKKVQYFIEPLTPMPNIITKDSFLAKVTSSIIPAPHDITFWPIPNGKDFIYIISVTQSPYAPHQYNNMYRMRIDGATHIAPHYFIESLFKKITFPRLEGYLTIRNIQNNIDRVDYRKSKYLVTITIYILNKSRLQNEENLYINLKASCGKWIVENPYNQTNNSYPSDDRMIMEPAKDFLFYGEPYAKSETLTLDYEDIKNASHLELSIFFGGKKSPLLGSYYEISMNFSNLMSAADYRHLIIPITENIFLHEVVDETYKDGEYMKMMLGR